jgi:hypothetical protein
MRKISYSEASVLLGEKYRLCCVNTGKVFRWDAEADGRVIALLRFRLV